MSRLILLNGAPGSGKSTLSRRYADEHTLTLGLDIDQVRAMIGRWLDHPTKAGLLARELAVAMARTHLCGGHDVLVPQYLGQVRFVDRLQGVATEVDATFIELALVSDPGDVVRRFERRTATSRDPAHRDAAELQRRSGGREQLAGTHDKLLAVISARPATRIVTVTEGDIDGTYRRLCAALKR